MEIIRFVQGVAGRFKGTGDSIGDTLRRSLPRVSTWPDDDLVLAVSGADIKTLVNTMYPLRRPHSFSSDRDLSCTGVQSSASSISGFSLFQTVGVPESGYGASLFQAQDTTSALLAEPSTSARPHLEPLVDPEIHSVQSIWVEEQLREVYAGIEEALTTGPPSNPDQWCILVEDVATQSPYTMKEKIFQSSKSIFRVADAHEGFHGTIGDNKSCRNAIEELLLGDKSVHDFGFSSGAGRYETSKDLYNCLLQMFDQHITSLEDTSNFVGAHFWFRKRGHFSSLFAEEQNLGTLSSLLHDIYRDKQQSLDRLSKVMESCDVQLRSMRSYFGNYDSELSTRLRDTDRLRDKMWYVADVRTSAVYDEVRAVASALKVMGKSKRPLRTRMAPTLRHWSASKSSTTSLYLKTEAQVIDILSAPPDHGGPNKLSDDQSKALSNWMERNTVENMCRGEERLHKLCMEIRKAVDQLTAANSTLMSSALFSHGKLQTSPQPVRSSSSPFWTPQGNAGRFDLLTLRTSIQPSIDAASTTSSHPLSARSSRDYLETRSPTLTNKSSAPFWSPVMTEAQSPSSATSVGSSQTQAARDVPSRAQGFASQSSSENTIEMLRQRTTSLLLSDLAGALFNEGSETDRAFWTGLGGDLMEKHLRTLSLGYAIGNADEIPSARFDFEKAFEKLLRQFSASSNPFVKLNYLHDIDTLLAHWGAGNSPGVLSSVTELRSHNLSMQQIHRRTTPPIADTKVHGFRRLFCNNSLRPTAIFRDLQYIAALVPCDTMANMPQERAFWNAAVAVAGLKQDVCQIMVETADSIIAYHSNNRGHGRSSSTAQQERDSATFSAPSRTPSAEDIGRYSMSDAAYLLQITAKEGDPVAQRELGTLYLTHPELMEHVIAPLSRPRDVFKEELEGKWRKNQDPNRCDPTTMCVAHHWMSLSSKAGDALAKEILKQREEMERLP